MKILTIGTFDIGHFGHLDLLNKISPLGDVIVGVNTDQFVKTFKDKPIMNQYERMKFIAALGYVTELNDSPGKELIESVRPDIVAIGSDWANRDYLKQIGVTQKWLDSRGISILYVSRPGDISTTEIKRRIREQG